MKINAQILRDKNACRNQIKLFVSLFGEDDAPITRDNCIKYASDFNFHWAVKNLLNEDQFKIYKEALSHSEIAYKEAMIPIDKAYVEARAPIDKVYKEALSPIDKAYKEALSPIDKAYYEARAPIDKVYDEAKAPIDKVYDKSIAVAFYDAIKE